MYFFLIIYKYLSVQNIYVSFIYFLLYYDNISNFFINLFQLLKLFNISILIKYGKIFKY